MGDSCMRGLRRGELGDDVGICILSMASNMNRTISLSCKAIDRIPGERRNVLFLNQRRNVGARRRSRLASWRVISIKHLKIEICPLSLQKNGQRPSQAGVARGAQMHVEATDAHHRHIEGKAKSTRRGNCDAKTRVGARTNANRDEINVRVSGVCNHCFGHKH